MSVRGALHSRLLLMLDPAAPELNAEDVIRHLTHELRQPLSALESIAYYLQLKVADSDPDACAQVSRLEQMVDNANWVLSDILHLLPMAPPNTSSVGIAELADEVLSECWASEGLTIQQDFQPDLPRICADIDQLRHLFRSVLQFLRRTIEEPRTVRVSAIPAADSVQIVFCTNAASTVTDALFRPLEANQLFTSRRIAENNRGKFTAEKEESGRLSIRLQLPAAALT